MGKNLVLKEFDDEITDDIYVYGAVELAFVGDAVFDLYIRTRLLKENPSLNSQKLHKIKSSIVNANFQAEIMMLIKNSLSESELAVFKRARNVSSKAAPKSTSASKYRNATGFEALIGSLFLQDKDERLVEIMDYAYNLKFVREE